MPNERYARQILAFGEIGQQRIEATTVGVGGLGGIGMQVTQSLAYLGVRRWHLVDDDKAEITNLNRLVTATDCDVHDCRPKTEIAARLIEAANPSSCIDIVTKNLRSRRALEALKKCDVIFGCVDGDGARLVLTEFAAAYGIVLIDSASDIIVENDTVREFGGRVVVARPGDFCLFCADQIDRAVAKEELETPEERRVRRQHGYGLGADTPAPAVVSLNGIIANMAVTEFLMLRTGLRPPNRLSTYRGMRGIVCVSLDQRQPDCFTCGYLAFSAERANIWRYCQEEVSQ